MNASNRPGDVKYILVLYRTFFMCQVARVLPLTLLVIRQQLLGHILRNSTMNQSCNHLLVTENVHCDICSTKQATQVQNLEACLASPQWKCLATAFHCHFSFVCCLSPSHLSRRGATSRNKVMSCCAWGQIGVYLRGAEITNYYQPVRCTAATVAHSKYRRKCKGEARNAPRVTWQLRL